MRIKYNLNKKNNYKKYIVITLQNSYNLNKKLDKESLGIIKFYDNDIINKVIKKKMDTKFKQILEMIAKIEEDDQDPSEGLMNCLNELDRLNKELNNKYRMYLEKKKFEFQEKKIMLLDKEIKMKLFNIQIINRPLYINNDGNEYEEEIEKESTRRR